MRLTNAAQVDLPPGIVRSCAVEVTDITADRLPVSFDQGRHVGMGQRPGSWMAIAFRLQQRVDLDHLREAWAAVVHRHGTLRTVFDVEGDTLVLDRVEVAPGPWTEHPAEGRTSREVVRAVLDATCRPFDRPSHRICLVDADRPAVVIGADHSHVDAWSLLLLARDLVACLDDVLIGRTPGGDLPVPLAFAAHTAELAARPDPPDEIRDRWAEILAAGGDAMPTFPLDLGDVTVVHPEVVEVRDVLDSDELGRFEDLAHDLGVGIISVAMAEVVRALRTLADVPLRAVFPVHSRYDERWHSSVGWFITNSVLECSSTDPVECGRAIKEAIRLGSHALGPIMAPYGGMPADPGMFAVSWLDHRRLPVEVDDGLEPQHVSAVIRTDGVMIWFVVNHTGLHLRCRYPDTEQARASVGRWIEAVVSGLQATVAVPA